MPCIGCFSAVFSAYFTWGSACVSPDGGFRNCTQDLHTFNALLTSWRAYCMVWKSYSSGELVLVVGSEHFTFRSVRTITDIANIVNVTF